jgi:hypothetical protein
MHGRKFIGSGVRVNGVVEWSLSEDKPFSWVGEGGGRGGRELK